MREEPNPFSLSKPWSPTVLEAHKDKPLDGEYLARFTEKNRGVWREWYRKWKPLIGRWPALENAYNELDRKKNFALPD